MAEVDLTRIGAELSVRVGRPRPIAAWTDPDPSRFRGRRYPPERLLELRDEQSIVSRCSRRTKTSRFASAAHSNDILEKLKELAGPVQYRCFQRSPASTCTALPWTISARNAADPVLDSFSDRGSGGRIAPFPRCQRAYPILAGPISKCARQSGRRAEVVAAIRPELAEQDRCCRSLSIFICSDSAYGWSRLSPFEGIVPCHPLHRSASPPGSRDPSKRPIEPRRPELILSRC